MSIEIKSELVRKLRDSSGAGMMDCKKALVESEGDLEKAASILRKKGVSSASKRGDRDAKEGVIASYIHAGDKVGVLVEINCETDFVARNDAFKAFVKDITLQVAAAIPQYVRREEVPQDLIDKEKETFEMQLKGKPPQVAEKIIAGKIDKFFGTICLLEQSFVKDSDITIKELLTRIIVETGENILIRRFSRFQLGESL